METDKQFHSLYTFPDSRLTEQGSGQWKGLMFAYFVQPPLGRVTCRPHLQASAQQPSPGIRGSLPWWKSQSRKTLEQNTLEISSKSSFSLYFAGSLSLQCCPNDSTHNGKLRFPKMGPRGWLVHGFVFHGADPRLYGIHVSNPERLLKTGKSLFFLTARFHLARPVHTEQRLLGRSFLLSISCGLVCLAQLIYIELKNIKPRTKQTKDKAVSVPSVVKHNS